MDIGAVDGETCRGTHTGACARLARELAAVTGPLRRPNSSTAGTPTGPPTHAASRAPTTATTSIGGWTDEARSRGPGSPRRGRGAARNATAAMQAVLLDLGGVPEPQRGGACRAARVHDPAGVGADPPRGIRGFARPQDQLRGGRGRGHGRGSMPATEALEPRFGDASS